MHRTAISYLNLLIPFCLLCSSFASAEETSTPSSQNSQTEPRIHSRFFSADAVEGLPKLQHLNAKDQGFNKILFKFTGFPINQEIVFETKRLASPLPDTYQQMLTFSIQEDGSLLTADQQQLKSLVCSSRGFLPGERVIFRARTAEGSIVKEISGIPSPVIVKDKEDKIVIKAELVSFEPTVYILDLPRMKEGEEYELKSTSIGEIVKAKPKFSKEKPLHYSPAVSGNSKGGISVLEIRRKSGELYVIKLPWGTALQPYLKGDKIYN